MSAPGTFKDRVNEKRRVSRRQSGASNRISGLESDTTSGEPRFFYAGEGDRDLAFVYHHCHRIGFGEQRQWITKENVEDHPRLPCDHEITDRIRFAWKYIMRPGRRWTNRQKEE